MPEPVPHTEQPEAPRSLVTGEATEPPLLFLALLWLPAFAVVAWGMMLVFGSKPWEFRTGGIVIPDPPRPPLDPRSEPPPDPPPPPGSDAPRS